MKFRLKRMIEKNLHEKESTRCDCCEIKPVNTSLSCRCFKYCFKTNSNFARAGYLRWYSFSISATIKEDGPWKNGISILIWLWRSMNSMIGTRTLSLAWIEFGSVILLATSLASSIRSRDSSETPNTIMSMSLFGKARPDAALPNSLTSASGHKSCTTDWMRALAFSRAARSDCVSCMYS